MASLGEIRSKIKLKEFTIDTKSAPESNLNKWSIETFQNKFSIDIKRVQNDEIEFDMIGIDPSIANAFRRILIAEVPSMAIEKVLVSNNTSIMADEVLAHRLGLIPIRADQRCFKFPKYSDTGELIVDETTVIQFDLDIKCQQADSAENNTSTNERYINTNVYTKHLQWIPIGDQATCFSSDPIKPVDDDILIMKLRPGQEIKLSMQCVKGIGKDHAKFSPVATAYYRLMPSIRLLQPIQGSLAEKLAKCFPEGVIGLKVKKGVTFAFVDDARKDTCTREVLRHKDLKDLVELGRERDHFIFTIESTGVIPASKLFTEAIKVLMEKCEYFINENDKRTK